MLPKTLLTAAFLSLAAAPVLAGGTVSFNFNAQNADEARAVQAGLALYRIAQGVDSGAFVHQDGSLNGAALIQAGTGSSGVIHQDGNGHSAILNQQGNGQNYGIFQFGDGADANVTQTADGETGFALQFGWD
ncbi:curlin [Rhodobacterales bacterium HKCCE2091]|nr:curlin [Rhodobacterales bacterium HKCCE2091]